METIQITLSTLPGIVEERPRQSACAAASGPDRCGHSDVAHSIHAQAHGVYCPGTANHGRAGAVHHVLRGCLVGL